MEARHHVVALGGREGRNDRLLRRSREQRRSLAARGQQETVRDGAAAVGAARHRAVEDGDASPARRGEHAGDVRDGLVARHRLRERAEPAAATDDALLALHHQERSARRVEQRVEVDRHQLIA